MDELAAQWPLGEIFATLCGLAWSFAVIMFRRLGETVHPLALNIFKSLLSLPVFVVLAVLLEGELALELLAWKPGLPWWEQSGLMSVLCGALGVAGADTLYFAALNRLGAGLTATLATLYTPGIFLWTWLLLGMGLEIHQMVGAGLVVLAAVMITAKPGGVVGLTRGQLISGAAFSVGCSLAASLSIVTIKPHLDGTSILGMIVLRYVGGVLGLGLLLGSHGNRGAVLRSLTACPDRRRLWASGFIGGVLAMLFWVSGFKYMPNPSLTAVLNQMSTVFLFALGVWLLKEPATKWRVAAVVLAVAGAVVANVSWGPAAAV